MKKREIEELLGIANNTVKEQMDEIVGLNEALNNVVELYEKQLSIECDY